ncbi:MAG TPA: hypothetical protein VFU81_17865 [Thermomicrobiales bacterium]|nr:hypothetical protein [Thermomicrobiales bacterium]
MRAWMREEGQRTPRSASWIRWSPLLAIVIALAFVALRHDNAFAAEPASTASDSHALSVAIDFPDGGIASDEQLCMAIFPGTATDLSKPPIQSRCLDSGQTSGTFTGLAPGDYQVIVPGPGSVISSSRYQGQRVDTSIPDQPDLNSFGIDVKLSLLPALQGVTGNVQVNVYGCPPGTNGGGDANAWASECNAVAGGIPVSLSGVGTIGDTSVEAVTGEQGPSSGKVEFTNLPAGAYQIDGKLPSNVSSPALFLESSIDGSLGQIDPQKPVSVRPAETVAVNVYLVLDNGNQAAPAATPDNGVGSDLTISGGV